MLTAHLGAHDETLLGCGERVGQGVEEGGCLGLGFGGFG